MTTFKKMIGDKTIKRADAMKIRYQDLHIKPGFNLRIPTDQLPENLRKEAEENDEQLFQHIMAGKPYPPLEVKPRQEGGVWIVEGHRRHMQIGRAIDAGAPIQSEDGEVWVPITQFTGNDADSTLRIMSSQDNRKLLTLEIARGYLRLIGFGWTVARIAQERNKSRTHVEGMLLLATANSDVQTAVLSGLIAPSAAIELIRQHGERAGDVIAQAAQRAQAEGKEKVTPRIAAARPRLTVKTLAPPLQKFLAAACEYERTEQGGADYVLVPAQALQDLQTIMSMEKE
ncbi:ParB/RepB/Spo0J family partition protein [Alcaligenes sp. Marseille-Q7550]